MATSSEGSPAGAAGAARLAIRAGRHRGGTAGLAPGSAQANLVVLPSAFATDFLGYCESNPGPCPLLEALPAGVVEPRSAAGADLRTDVPAYRVYRDGHLVAEPRDLLEVWEPDLTAFLLGCSYTFERALLDAGFELPHYGAERPVAMYRTDRPTRAAGAFRGPLVVSMRWIPAARVEEAAAITARYPHAHGAPVHAGDPAALGIADLARPDYGAAWPRPADAVPVFWACGVTPQVAAVEARLPLMITHAPGSMLVTDVPEAGASG